MNAILRRRTADGTTRVTTHARIEPSIACHSSAGTAGAVTRGVISISTRVERKEVVNVIGNVGSSISELGQFVLSDDHGSRVDKFLDSNGSGVLRFADLKQGTVAAACLHALEVVEVLDCNADTCQGLGLGGGEV